MKLLVAIPCLNEGRTIASVIERIPKDIPGISSIRCLVIDDGSTDNTVEVARSVGANVIRNVRNRGVGYSFQAAVAYATDNDFDLMVNIDGDGQFNPKDISKLLSPILAGEAEFVTASRFIDPEFHPDMPVVKFYGNHIMSRLISALSGDRFYDVSCGFRAYSRNAFLNLNLLGKFTYTQETFLDLSVKRIRIKEVPIRVQYFADRKSRVASNLFAYGFKTLKIILRSYRDYYPLRFFWLFAMVFFMIAVALGGFFFFKFWQTGYFTGNLWAGFSAAFTAFVGLAFFVLGIVTDMLDRQRITSERMLFLIKKYKGSSVMAVSDIRKEDLK